MTRCDCGFEGVDLWFLNLTGPGFSQDCRYCQLWECDPTFETKKTQDDEFFNAPAPTKYDQAAATRIGCTVTEYLARLYRGQLYCPICTRWKSKKAFAHASGSADGRQGYCRKCNRPTDRPRFPITLHQGL
jgi:hypothetical protein